MRGINLHRDSGWTVNEPRGFHLFAFPALVSRGITVNVILAIGIPNKLWWGINFRLASANLRFRIYSRPGRCRGWMPVQLEGRLPHARYPECDMSRGLCLMGFTVREFPGLCMYPSVVSGTSARVDIVLRRYQSAYARQERTRPPYQLDSQMEIRRERWILRGVDQTCCVVRGSPAVSGV